jgi:phosphoserine phosphatase
VTAAVTPDFPLSATPDRLARSLRGEAREVFLARLAGPPGLAAFDADGTLWDGDLGEAVLLELIAAGQLIGAPADPWAQYLDRFSQGAGEAFAYAGRLMAGLSEDLVREVSARVYAADFRARVFPEARWLLEVLIERGWEVYVVSASNRWSIEVAARDLGLPAERVVALDLETAGGVLTTQVRLPVPTLEGKPSLLRARAGRAADLAFGNSLLDLPLLLSATVPVGVGLLEGPDARPNAFLVEAARRGWARLEIPGP